MFGCSASQPDARRSQNSEIAHCPRTPAAFLRLCQRSEVFPRGNEGSYGPGDSSEPLKGGSRCPFILA